MFRQWIMMFRTWLLIRSWKEDVRWDRNPVKIEQFYKVIDPVLLKKYSYKQGQKVRLETTFYSVHEMLESLAQCVERIKEKGFVEDTALFRTVWTNGSLDEFLVTHDGRIYSPFAFEVAYGEMLEDLAVEITRLQDDVVLNSYYRLRLSNLYSNLHNFTEALHKATLI